VYVILIIFRKIHVYVSTNKDPYVFALYNGTLHFSKKSQTYGAAAIWLIATSITLVFVPMIIIYKNKRNENPEFDINNINKSISDYFNRSGDDSKLEMTQIRQTSKEESFKNLGQRI